MSAITQKSYETVVLALPAVSTSVSFSILDALASVGRDWELLHGTPPKHPVFHTRLLSLDGEAYADPNGRQVQPDGALADCKNPDLIIVPDLHIDPNQPLSDELGPMVAWIRAAHARGAIVSSVYSGAMLLSKTGLLDGEDATTHWGYYQAFNRYFPKVQLRRERILVPSGDGHKIITAGGASAWADLMLYLIGRFAGQEEARHIARLYLLQPHTQGQLHYASLTAGCQHEDGLIANAQAWAADQYASSNPVATMAERSGLSERSFYRRFRRATGQSPVDYVQTLRIEEAKQLLETTDLPIDEIAEEVGYAEGSSFRHLFRRHVGMTATAYRRQRHPAPGNYGNDRIATTKRV